MRHTATILAVGAAYYVGGKAGLLLAIPPGYATTVWPPSGLALVAVLLYGYRVWPGVLLGSMVLNSEISFQAATADISVAALWPAASIAAGATVQAVTGAFLIRRFVGFPTPLVNEGDVVKFLVLGSPVSCLINATWANASLLAAGTMDLNSVPFSWFTWWVGDALGVVVFTPIVLIWLGKPRRIWWDRRYYLAISLGVAFAASITLFVFSSNWERERLQLEFERQVSGISQKATLNVKSYLDALYSIRGFFDSSDRVDRVDFRTFASGLYRRNEGIQALEWIPRVRTSERDEYEKRAREKGYPEFRITEKSAAGAMVTAGDRSEYFPVYFVEPYVGNEKALGFDLASNPTRLEALEQARDRGEPVATARIRLVQETGDQFAFLVFLPIYADQAARTIAQRFGELEGFALGVFRIGNVVEAALQDANASEIHLVIEDVGSEPGKRRLFEHGTTLARVSELGWKTELKVADRRWLMQYSPSVDYLVAQRTWHTWIVPVGCLLFTGLLEAFLLTVTGRTARVEQLVAERTSALTSEIEERARVEVALKLAKDEAESANRAKSEFLANMSHELRTPLNAIIGYSEMLYEEAEQRELSEIAEDLSKITGAGNHLFSLISDVLDLSKIEAGRAEILVESVPVGVLVGEVVETIRTLAGTNGNSLKVDVQPSLGECHTDQTKLRQILYNMLSNAAKFTTKGSIDLRVRRVVSATNEWLEFEVQDRGIGMSDEQMGHIFDAFVQADASTTRKFGGTGLGLAITKHFCEMLGGEISVESTEGIGSTFTVRLPADARAS